MAMGAPGAGTSVTSFVGSAVARYDVDELDDLGRAPKRQKFVEVRRPDGTVAKARGERTFHGAFTGGFSAGYWGTVGSKEGWEPATFVSSRSKRQERPAPRAEDLMDEEDLRDHRASHRVVEAHGAFAGRAGGVAAARSAVPGGLPPELEQELFRGEEALGARLLRAGSAPELDDAPAPPGRRTYGCAPPPPPAAAAAAAESEATGGVAWEFKLAGKGGDPPPCTQEARKLEAQLERLWRSKADLHSVGYAGGVARVSGGALPGRRLYMSSKRGAAILAGASGYGAFGTGVFDMDDHDDWEDVYDGASRSTELHLAIRDQDDDAAVAIAHSPRPDPRQGAAPGDIPGFVLAARPDDDADGVPRRLRPFLAPPPPRGYSGAHAAPGGAAEEARGGSAEHQQLLEFLGRHGDRRLVDPGHRAELLGLRARRPAPAPPASQPSPSAPSSAAAEGGGASDMDAARAASQPLWRGVDDDKKELLLKAMGRSFVAGAEQDMGGRAGRHQPYRSDPRKQRRYATFCLALEGAASSAQALADSGGLGEAERQAELAEFGRVYRLFRQEHPEAHLTTALAVETAAPAATAPGAFRRTVQPLAPEVSLFRQGGRRDADRGRREPAAQPPPQAAPPAVSRYVAPDFALASAVTAATGASAAPPSGFSAGPAAGGEAPRPPKSLFASIFDDDASDDEAR